METISSVLTQTLFILVLLIVPLYWFIDRRRKRSLSSHYAGLNFKPVTATEIQRILNTDRFTLLEKKWLQSGRTSELQIGRFEGLDMAQFTLIRSDGSQAGRHQTVTFIKGGVALPRFVLRPESMADRLIDRFKGVDIDFESHPRFSQAYQLEAEDEAAVRAFFSDTLLNYFEENTGFSLESVGNDVLVYRAYKRVSTGADIDVQLRLAHTTYQRLLEHGQH